MFKLIVAGGRTFNDYELLKTKLDHLLKNKEIGYVEIVSGGANGADKLGERYANEKGCMLKIFNANWDAYGKSAGYKRNAQMADYGDACVAFWDGKSKGSKHMIDLANKKGIRVVIARY